VDRGDRHGVTRTFRTLTDTDLFRIVYYAERGIVGNDVYWSTT